MREIKRKSRRHRTSNGCRLLLIGMAIVLLTQSYQINLYQPPYLSISSALSAPLWFVSKKGIINPNLVNIRDGETGRRGDAKRESIGYGMATEPQNNALPSSLPVPKTHPLPLTLAQWHDATGSGDYFSSVQPTPVGYLVWWQFPIKVYVQRPTDPTESPSSLQRFQNWVSAVVKAVQEWNAYLPLEVVEKREDADISFLRSRPPIGATINRETGQFNIPRARAAQTRYEFYLRPAGDAAQQVLAHRFTIQLSPDQTVDYTLATARHELGHALGIWGHSPQLTDTMYFSQVRRPPQISTRDINTLKQIYEQPTRVGWPLTAQPPGIHSDQWPVNSDQLSVTSNQHIG